MIRRHRLLNCAFVTLAAIAGVAVADASTISARLNGVSPSRIVGISIDGGWHYSNLRAGELDWSKTGGNAPNIPSHFSTFCIEISKHVSSGANYTYNIAGVASGPTSILGGMGASKADAVAELCGRYLGGPLQSDGNYGAALQLAIWEIVMDGGRDLSSGNFRARNRGGYYSLAQNMLSSINGAGPRATLTGLLQDSVQDQIYVPEPASLVLIALGALSQLRRR